MLSIAGIERIIEPALARLGLVMHGAELKREGRELVLRVIVDRAEKKSSQDGVTVDELAVASDEVGAALDLEDPIEERYRLTLESPGVERDLSTIRQFRFAIGERVRIVTRGEEAEVVEGELKAVDENAGCIEVMANDGMKTIDTAIIKSARTIFDWDAGVGTKRKF